MAADQPFLPYGRQHVEADDIEAVAQILKSEYLTTGPVVEAFESKLAEATNSTFAVCVSSGTAALHLSALALGLKEGDVVIVPSMTFLATANAVRYVRADVQFADVDPNTGLLTPETFSQALDRAGVNAKAVMPVHINGQTADMRAISQVPQFDRLVVVEDACHALGGSYVGPSGEMQPVGSNLFGDLTVFSFHPVKTIAMGEGGAITTNDEALASKLRTYRNIGMTNDPKSFQNISQAFDSDGSANPWYYEMAEIGFNYRASAIHCGIGLSQLAKLCRFVERRSALMARYEELLLELNPLVQPLLRVSGCEAAWHLCVVLIDFEAAGITRAQLMRVLRDKGIGTQVHYIPVHLQPYYKKLYGDLNLPGAEAYYSRVLSLPLFFSMTDDDVERVVTILSQALRGTV